MIFSIRMLSLQFINNSLVENELALWNQDASSEEELVKKHLDLREISLPNDSQLGRKVFAPRSTTVNIEELYGRMMLRGGRMYVIDITENQMSELAGPQIKKIFEGYANGQ
jgi:hypothetical protein